MNDRNRNRRHSGLRTDPKISALLQDSVENRAALTKKQKQDRARQKATYDLPPEIQNAVTQIARKEDTSTSQIVAMFLAYAVAHYQAKENELVEGMAERSRSRTPRFSWNLQIPPVWLQMAGEVVGQKDELPPGWKKHR